MDKIKKRRKNKLLGAVISAIVIAVVIIGIIVSNICYIYSATEFLWYLVVESIIMAIVLIGIIAALILRIKEIRGGEEDDSSKY